MFGKNKNASQMLRAMKNKSQTREQKIAFRKQYENEQSGVVN